LSTAVYGGLDSPVEQSNMGNVFLCSASLLLLLLLLFSNIWVRMEISFVLREMNVQQIMDALHAALIPSPD